MTPKEMRFTMRAASFDLSDSRRMCCHADLLLIESTIELMHDDVPDGMAVVQLGAGSGTMALMVMSNIHTRMLVTIDHEQQALNWEEQVLKNCGWTGNASENGSPAMPYYTAKFADSTYPDFMEEFSLYHPDLIIIDADHSYEGVRDDLHFWRPLAHAKAVFFLHDYRNGVIKQGSEEVDTESYPGVKQAADEFFGREADMVEGWSGVFFNELTRHD